MKFKNNECFTISTKKNIKYKICAELETNNETCMVESFFF